MVDETESLLFNDLPHNDTSPIKGIVSSTTQESLITLEWIHTVIHICRDLAGEGDEVIEDIPKTFKRICVWPKNSLKNINIEDPKIRIVFTDKGINASVVRKKWNGEERFRANGIGVDDIKNAQDNMQKFLAGEDIVALGKWILDGGISKDSNMSDADIAEYLQYIKFK